MKNELLLLTLLVLLNIILRLPTTPHEVGSDSYYIHGVANSIVEYGGAKWIVNPLSLLGLYPYSYSSGVPYLLAVFSGISGLSMERSIYFVSLTWWVTGFFGAYSLAKELKDELIFSVLTAFIFSTSPLAIKYTMWTVATRGQFYMLMPLLILVLFRLRSLKQKKYLLLALTISMLMAVTHKMFILLLPMGVVFLISLPLAKFANKKVRYLIVSLFPIFFFPQFFIIRGWWALRFLQIESPHWPDFLTGFLYNLLGRYGLIFPLAILGIVTILLFKEKVSHQEMFIVLTTLMFTPILLLSMYPYESMLLFYSILAAFGSMAVVGMLKKYVSASSIIPTITMILLIFSMITLQVRFTSNSLIYGNYMRESTYYVAKYMQKETEMEPFTGVEVKRIQAYVLNPSPVIIKETDPFVYNMLSGARLNIHFNELRISSADSFSSSIQMFVKYPLLLDVDLSTPTPQYLVFSKAELTPGSNPIASKDNEDSVDYLSYNRLYTNNRESLLDLR